jgi:adenine-specific DNA-methyltransferase
MSEGFEENIEFFRLDFLDPDDVARGDAFQAILPILWMMAGCQGAREDSKGSQPWFIQALTVCRVDQRKRVSCLS